MGKQVLKLTIYNKRWTCNVNKTNTYKKVKKYVDNRGTLLYNLFCVTEIS